MRLLRGRHLGVMIAFAGVAVCALVAGWWIFFGSGLNYPSAAPVPRTASVLVTDTSWDDDDPIRSRESVIDVEASSLHALISFYRHTYPSSGGWTKGQGKGPEPLCLVNRSRSDYIQVLDVLHYRGHRVAARPGRCLVVISRVEHIGGGDHPCGYAGLWIPSDLL